MKKFLLIFVLFSCSEPEVEPFDFGQQNQDIVTDASGNEYPFLDPNVISYCGAGWGRKFCRFLSNYDGTSWTDTENQENDFLDIQFSNFSNNENFMSFYNIDDSSSDCEVWKFGETIVDGLRWNIKIKKDEEHVLWFDYDYYGLSEEIEYSRTYKYEVIDGLLNFSITEDQTYTFSPSEGNSICL